MNKDSAWFDTSPERIHQVVGEITLGSEPGGRFYALVAISTLIASLGLVANSTAVIIGAMLVAPLMTPIFGISLALVRGDNRLLGVALRAEVAGVFVAVAIGTLFGILPLALRVTGEMLSRTSPNLLDLLVAVLAGFAGSYAMVDERLSPALPGVAIATAIVPPLANCGLCLAVGAYDGAVGSFLLFLANFFSILLVASATFIAAGLTTKAPNFLSWEFVRRFGLAGLGFFVIAAFLTLELVEMVKERHLTKSIQTVLSQKFEGLHGASLEKAIHKLSRGKLYALASVRTPRVISPDQVKAVQKDLADKVGIPTELMVRCLLSKDVSATGSNLEVTDQNLNGVFFGKVDSHELKIRKVEQLLRERLPQKPGFELLNVELGRFSGAPVVMGTIRAPRALLPEEMRELEKAIQENLQDPDIEFVVR